MHTTRAQRLIALLLAGSLALAGAAGAQQPAPQSAAQAAQPASAAQGRDAVPTEVTGSDVEPKFIWGFLINVVLSKLASAAFDTFTNWLSGRMRGVRSTLGRLPSGLPGFMAARHSWPHLRSVRNACVGCRTS